MTKPVKEWNVRVRRRNSTVYQFLGTVIETEEHARHAALHKFGSEENDTTDSIGPDEEFEVSERRNV